MANVVVPPNADVKVTLQLNGQVFAADGVEIASKLNALIAAWNTKLGRNLPGQEATKIFAKTDPAK
jgi:hypothetical protein